MKRIIDINEKDYEFIKQHGILKGYFPIGWKEIADSKPLQEELEKLKTKINYDCEHFKYDSDHYAIDSWEVNNIIDKRISELKGNKNE